MPRLSLLLLGLLAAGSALGDEPAPGRFRLRVPEEAARVARLSGKAAPAGRLSLLAGGAFVLQADGAVRRGSYRRGDGRLVLTTDDGGELRGELRGERATLEGLSFEREAPADLAGAWTVHRNGHEEKGLRMEHEPDGKFRFSMAGATSEGEWSIADGKLALVWTKIDGEPVEEPGSIHKESAVAGEGASFQIDTYRYERATTG